MSLEECGLLDNHIDDILHEKDSLIPKEHVGRRESGTYFLYFSVFSVGLIIISGGAFGVWTSPVLRKLRSNDTQENPLGIPITTYQTSVLAGMLTFGNMIGPLILKLFIDRLGRKLSLMILAATTCLSSIMIACSENFITYCLSRGIIGLCMGTCNMIMPIYITEITEDHNRGKIGVIAGIFQPLGHLYGYATGPLLSVRNFTLTCALPLLLSLFIFGTFVPDSPVHLVYSGKKQKALKSLRKLRNVKYGKVEEELLSITRKLADTKIEHDGVFGLLKNRPFRLGLAIVLGLKITVALSGMMTISAFIAPIFNDASVGVSGDVVAISLAMIELVTFSFISSIIENVGRRTLLLFSAMGSSICHAMIGFYFHLKSINFHHLNYFTWLPVASVILFYITFAIGLGCVPRILTGKIFPSNVRATAVSLVSFIFSLFLFSVMSAFPILQEFLGNAYCFWLFSSFCVLGFSFIYFVVPETKGRNIIEVLQNVEQTA